MQTYMPPWSRLFDSPKLVRMIKKQALLYALQVRTDSVYLNVN